jgi:hypothetical protein
MTVHNLIMALYPDYGLPNGRKKAHRPARASFSMVRRRDYGGPAVSAEETIKPANLGGLLRLRIQEISDEQRALYSVSGTDQSKPDFV